MHRSIVKGVLEKLSQATGKKDLHIILCVACGKFTMRYYDRNVQRNVLQTFISWPKIAIAIQIADT